MSERHHIRQQIRLARRQLTTAEQQAASEVIIQHVADASHLARADKVALYLANDGELDPQPLIDWYWSQGTRVYLPVLHHFSPGHLLFLRYDPDTAMTANRFGIPEPRLDIRLLLPKQELDIIYTPLVAFDSTGNRIGMGGGFYDRTLAAWRHGLGPRPVGLAHNCQQLPAIPTDSWDIPLPELITPDQHWRW
ncbi:5-formyltetrahydrofolate cyclo-ligase [Oceanisphaera arctica]|uniref:5-formyltetrahydrofolate cyclo-ligase n=1 Tax=Oceanisphaera arctica TaxID=641510 RepID=A0A2P5TLQ3_9GAMM|nr:5-formyltetrahydrofolate cyclo-ligase [Oceanisphaera arctica]PPL16207.1 5-formyltetrahydrofolate cyclo-ligase [Oceanisphaera arctica]GHA11434.1 5-formyltetrahydrofolate cyclo-ligase [Oceanisphaera arctica]